MMSFCWIDENKEKWGKCIISEYSRYSTMKLFLPATLDTRGGMCLLGSNLYLPWQLILTFFIREV